jgi:hypothetical protein
MSSRQDKKKRQFFRREFVKKYEKKATEMAEWNSSMMKPKPKWIPMAVWIWALGFFIKIKKPKK